MAEQPSRRVFDGIFTRVLVFLIGVGKYFPIRAALSAKGYTEAQHELAWGHIKKLAVFPPAAHPSSTRLYATPSSRSTRGMSATSP